MKTPFKQQFQRLLCAVCAAALMMGCALPAAAAEGAADASDETLTAAEAREMSQADSAVTALTDSEEYEAMTTTQRTDAAVAELKDLADKGLVRADSLYVDEENGMVTFTYSCGALGGILLDDLDDEEPELYAVGGETDEENGLLEFSSERYEFIGNAMIYYAFDDLLNSSRYPYYAYMQAVWTTMGLATQMDTAVTVNDLRGMGNYNVCVLSAHGAYFTYSSNYFTHELDTAPVILLLEESSMWKDLFYGVDLLTHRVIKVNGRYGVTPEFFSNAYQSDSLRDTIILSEMCEFFGVDGSIDSSMADALLNGGACAVVGFVNNVYAVYSRSMVWNIVNRMIAGDTVGQALEHAKNTYGADDLIWYHSKGGTRPHATASYAVLYGDENVGFYFPAAQAA